MREVSVSGEEHVELTLGEPKKPSILCPRPSRICDGTHVELGKVSLQKAWKVFVEEYPLHATRASRARVACSRNALICSRLTLGKLSKNSSTL